MHVLFLLAQQHWTGAAEPMLQLARGLADRGWRTSVAWTRVPPGALEDRVPPLGLGSPPGVTFVRKGFHPFSTWNDIRGLRGFVARENVDIIFANQSHDHWLGLLARPPVLVRQIHASRQLAPRFGQGWLFRRTDALIVAATRWKEDVIAAYGLPPECVFVLPPAVDAERFSPAQDVAAIRREIGAAPDDRLIGLVSRIKAGRGHDLALAAFARVRERLPNARLLFIGHGEGQADVEAAARATNFADRVHFLGYRSDDLPAATAALDVALLLGEGADGACRAALEAMACGVPVAALRVGTLTETLLDGETGRFVEANPESLAAGILEILAAPDWRRRAREHAASDLSPARRLDAAEAILREIAARRR